MPGKGEVATVFAPGGVANVDEAALIRAAQSGDQSAFETLVETYDQGVLRLAGNLLRSEQDAFDIYQETFLRVYKNLHNFRFDCSFRTWLYRITISKAMDHERRKRRKKRFALVQSLFGKNDEQVVDVPDFNHPGVLLDRKEKAAILFGAMKTLPDNQRVAFVLNKVEGLTYQEISEVMQTSVSAVESLLHRAKTNLRKQLKDFYQDQ